MPTGLQTNGFPLADEFAIPEHVRNRPEPPPAAEDQPFGYRFREVSRPTGKPIVNPVYDPEHQVTRIDGDLPDAKWRKILASGGGTTSRVPKYSYKWFDGFLVPDVTYDVVPDT